MKKLLLALFITLGSLAVQAQDLKWHTNMDEAVKLSNKSKKPLFLFFTGSDWCGWCIRLQKEVLKTPEFAEWAKKNVILVELDFPRKAPQTDEIKMQNAGLAQAFAIQGYPTVVITKATKGKDGKLNLDAYGQQGYLAGGPSAWLAAADKIIAGKK